MSDLFNILIFPDCQGKGCSSLASLLNIQTGSTERKKIEKKLSLKILKLQKFKSHKLQCGNSRRQKETEIY